MEQYIEENNAPVVIMDDALSTMNKWLVGINMDRQTRAFASYRVLK